MCKSFQVRDPSWFSSKQLVRFICSWTGPDRGTGVHPHLAVHHRVPPAGTTGQGQHPNQCQGGDNQRVQDPWLRSNPGQAQHYTHRVCISENNCFVWCRWEILFNNYNSCLKSLHSNSSIENTIAIAESQQYRLSKSKWQCELLWIALCWQKIRKIKHWKYYGFENPWVFKFLVCKTLDIFLSDENIIWHHLHLQDFPFSFPSRCDIINMHISLWDPFFFLMNEQSQWYELPFFWAFHHAFVSSLFAICKSNVVTCDQHWVMGHLEACDWSGITHPWLWLVVTGTLLIPAHDHWLLCTILTSKTI